MFKKGESGNPGGRPQGAKDKAQTDIKEAFRSLVEGNIGNFQNWIDAVAKKNPERAFDMVVKLMEFTLPKLKSVEVASCEKEAQGVQIVFKDFAAEKKKEIDLSKLSDDELRTLMALNEKAGNF